MNPVVELAEKLQLLDCEGAQIGRTSYIPIHRETLRSIVAALTELAEGKEELGRLMDSVWLAEYRESAPEWKPLPDLVGMVTQIDNMYAGVRNERDRLKVEMRRKGW